MRLEGLRTRWKRTRQCVLQRHDHFGWEDPSGVREIGADGQMQLVVVGFLLAALGRVVILVDTRIFRQAKEHGRECDGRVNYPLGHVASGVCALMREDSQFR